MIDNSLRKTFIDEFRTIYNNSYNKSIYKLKIKEEKDYKKGLLYKLKDNALIKKLTNSISCFFKKKIDFKITSIIDINTEIIGKMDQFHEDYFNKSLLTNDKNKLSNDVVVGDLFNLLILSRTEEEIKRYHFEQKYSAIHPTIEVLQFKGFSRCSLSLDVKTNSVRFFQKYTNNFLFLSIDKLEKTIISQEIKDYITIHQIEKMLTSRGIYLRDLLRECNNFTDFEELSIYIKDLVKTKSLTKSQNPNRSTSQISQSRAYNKYDIEFYKEVENLFDSYKDKYEMENLLNLRIYNFSLLFTGEKEIEIVVSSYQDLKIWLNGLAFIIKEKLNC